MTLHLVTIFVGSLTMTVMTYCLTFIAVSFVSVVLCGVGEHSMFMDRDGKKVNDVVVKRLVRIFHVVSAIVATATGVLLFRLNLIAP